MNISFAEDFYTTKTWSKYLFYRNSEFKIKGGRFYFSAHKDLKAELEASLNYFQKKKKHQNGKYYHCLFPARFLILKEHFPLSNDLEECRDFNEFKSGLDIEDIFLVFTSAYANNPASMFGHTFLRFSRKSKGRLDSTKELLGYSAAFQARTNPDDNPIEYTFKGLFGGYTAYPEIKPQYVNIGIYNNGESRDLWEVKLNLTSNEKELMMAILWELSHSGAFDYYFFDENCSTFLLYIFEILRPHIDFKSLNETFVVPQTTYKEVQKYFSSDQSRIRLSLGRNIESRYLNLSSDHKKEISESLVGDLSDNHEVLDIAVDYWKFKNYKEKTQLSQVEKQIMLQTYNKRAKLNNITQDFDYVPSDERPELAHDKSLFSLGISNLGVSGRLRYGFHDFNDPQMGYDNKSFINFLDISLRQDYIKLTIGEILSLQQFNLLFKNFSWSVGSQFEQIKGKKLSEFYGGVGLFYNFNHFKFYSLVLLNYINYQDIVPHQFSNRTGLKLYLNKKLRLTLNTKFYSKKMPSNLQLALNRTLKEGDLEVEYSRLRGLSEQVTLSYKYYF